MRQSVHIGHQSPASISRNTETGRGEKRGESCQLGSRRHVDENQPRCGVERYETENGKPEWQAIGSRFIGKSLKRQSQRVLTMISIDDSVSLKGINHD